MRLHIGLVVLATVIAQIPRDADCDSSVQDTEDTSLANGQDWIHGSESEVYREEPEIEPEMNKRVRNRGGKRRRRLRQRPRSTTERPLDVDSADELHTAASSVEGSENEEVVPRRRPSGKRRRRPLRRYHDDEQSAPRPRRRKGGRKRIRPQFVNTDDIETTTYISIDYDPPATSKVMFDELTKTEQTSQMLDKVLDLQSDDNMEQPINSEVATYTLLQINNSTQNMKEITESVEEDANENKEYNELILPQNKEENIIIQNQSNSKNEFGNKIFDRKALFSSSRKLPETSATLRRRLIPRTKNSTKNFPFGNHVRIIKPLANLESELETKQEAKNEVITQSNEFTERPQIGELYQLKNTINSQVVGEQHLEEPNYPQLDLFIKKNKSVLNDDSKESTTPIEYPITTTLMDIETTTIPQNVSMEEVKLSAHNHNTNNSTSQLPNLDDEVIDLLKSDKGNNRLQKILELRNMTISQLLDHRKRGSRTFHLADIFTKPQPKFKEEKSEENITHPTMADEISIFSPENILNSTSITVTENANFPESNPSQIQNNYNSEKDTSLLSKQINRESRIFDSLPDFTSTKATMPEVRPYPTWRIIPNPKLKPVSIRGDYKEIKISNVVSTKKPFPGTDIDNIFLLEDRDNFIQHGNNGAATITSEGRENTFLFRKIPVSVKSAIVVSGAILVLAIFGFLSVLVSCRLRHKKARLRAKQDILCEHLQNDDFMASQQSLSPVLNKHNRGPVFSQGVHSNTSSNRHYYLWRTLRKTFQYD